MGMKKNKIVSAVLSMIVAISAFGSSAAAVNAESNTGTNTSTTTDSNIDTIYFTITDVNGNEINAANFNFTDKQGHHAKVQKCENDLANGNKHYFFKVMNSDELTLKAEEEYYIEQDDNNEYLPTNITLKIPAKHINFFEKRYYLSMNVRKLQYGDLNFDGVIDHEDLHEMQIAETGHYGDTKQYTFTSSEVDANGKSILKNYIMTAKEAFNSAIFADYMSKTCLLKDNNGMTIWFEDDSEFGSPVVKYLLEENNYITDCNWYKDGDEGSTLGKLPADMNHDGTFDASDITFLSERLEPHDVTEGNKITLKISDAGNKPVKSAKYMLFEEAETKNIPSEYRKAFNTGDIAIQEEDSTYTSIPLGMFSYKGATDTNGIYTFDNTNIQGSMNKKYNLKIKNNTWYIMVCVETNNNGYPTTYAFKTSSNGETSVKFIEPKWGDLNFDGVIDNEDLVLMQKAKAGWKYQIPNNIPNVVKTFYGYCYGAVNETKTIPYWAYLANPCAMSWSFYSKFDKKLTEDKFIKIYHQGLFAEKKYALSSYADVNGDRKINSKDLELIAKCAAGHNVKLGKSKLSTDSVYYSFYKFLKQ